MQELTYSPVLLKCYEDEVASSTSSPSPLSLKCFGGFPRLRRLCIDVGPFASWPLELDAALEGGHLPLPHQQHAQSCLLHLVCQGQARKGSFACGKHVQTLAVQRSA